MAASGLTEKTNFADNRHVIAATEYALAIREQLQYVNAHCFNNFQMRIGWWNKSSSIEDLLLVKSRQSQTYCYLKQKHPKI